MARGGPSMTALLGLLAVAGYQNRERLAELFGRVAGTGGRAGGASPGGMAGGGMAGSGMPGGGMAGGGTQGGAMAGGGMPGGGMQGGGMPGGGMPAGGMQGGVGGFLAEGLRDLVDRFRETGRGETAESWVQAGPNRDCSPADIEAAIGPETMAELERQTGLTRAEVVARLCRDLPDAVDRYTPEGRLPDA